MNKKVVMLAMLGLIPVILLSACTGISDKEESRVKISSEQNAHRATDSLLAQADTQEKEKQWEHAAAYLERALRIEPRNGFLWHRLARIRMNQGQYSLAESLIQKSSSLAGDDQELLAKNQQLLEQLRMYNREAPL